MLTTLLEGHRDDISLAWAERLRQLPDSRYRNWSSEELRTWCTGALDAIVRSRVLGSDEVLRAHANKMAGVRAEQGFQIAEVVGGVLLLHEAALPFLMSAQGASPAQIVQALLELDASLRVMAAQFATLLTRSMRRTVEQVAVLEERQRVARDLHDLVAQSLYGVSMCAEAAARLLEAGDTAASAAHLREVRDAAGEALREMRFLIFELRPSILQDAGLVEALSSRLAAVERRAGVTAELAAEAMDRLPVVVEEALYGIAREALNNSLRHSHATRLTVGLRREAGALALDIRDNGLGFDPQGRGPRGGIGLGTMRERAQRIGASLSVTSQPGRGTHVRVSLPLDRLTPSPAAEKGVKSS